MIALLTGLWSGPASVLKAAIALIGGFLVGTVLTWAVVTFSYEGLRLPLIGQVIDGSVQRSVKAATEQLVSRAEYDGLVAVLARKEIETQTANAAAAALRSKITQAEKAKSDAETRLEAELAADRDPNRAIVTDADLKWMSKH